MENIIEVSIKGQEIIIDKLPLLVEDSVNYIWLKTNFSPEWEDVSKKALFRKGGQITKTQKDIEVDFDGETIIVPPEVLSKPEFFFGFYGEKKNENGEVIKRLTTNVYYLSVFESMFGLSDKAENVFSPYEDVMEEYFFNIDYALKRLGVISDEFQDKIIE